MKKNLTNKVRVMNTFKVSQWFANRAKLKIQIFIVEGVEFELMALNENLIDDIKSCLNYEEMLSLAANSGMSFNRKRVIDDAELAKDIDMLWGLEDLDVDLDPCIKYRVGEKVCDISGLNSTLEEMLASQELKEMETLKEQGYIDGDSETPTVTIDQLNDDADIAKAYQL